MDEWAIFLVEIMYMSQRDVLDAAEKHRVGGPRVLQRKEQIAECAPNSLHCRAPPGNVKLVHMGTDQTGNCIIKVTFAICFRGRQCCSLELERNEYSVYHLASCVIDAQRNTKESISLLLRRHVTERKFEASRFTMIAVCPRGFEAYVTWLGSSVFGDLDAADCLASCFEESNDVVYRVLNNTDENIIGNRFWAWSTREGWPQRWFWRRPRDNVLARFPNWQDDLHGEVMVMGED